MCYLFPFFLGLLCGLYACTLCFLQSFETDTSCIYIPSTGWHKLWVCHKPCCSFIQFHFLSFSLFCIIFPSLFLSVLPLYLCVCVCVSVFLYLLSSQSQEPPPTHTHSGLQCSSNRSQVLIETALFTRRQHNDTSQSPVWRGITPHSHYSQDLLGIKVPLISLVFQRVRLVPADHTPYCVVHRSTDRERYTERKREKEKEREMEAPATHGSYIQQIAMLWWVTAHSQRWIMKE